MAILNGKKFRQPGLLEYIGDISQVGGIKTYELNSGKGKGIMAVDIKTGSGFAFTVLPDRGMDLCYAEYKGQSLCWRSTTGDVSPFFFEKEGLDFLSSCSGGLLFTCGLSNVGSPCTDSGEEFGLHGKISNIPASNIQIYQKWEDDEFIMSVQGEVRETAVFGTNLLLTRNITAKLGESKLFIRDTIENQGFESTPVMVLYHINIGYPLLDENAQLLSPTRKLRPRDAQAEDGKENFATFQKPTAGYSEKCYYHDMVPDKKGEVQLALVNRKLNKGEGLGVYIKYPKRVLPRFTQWKMMRQGLYVCGLEPANCGVEGRVVERQRKTLTFLKPQQKIQCSLEMGVLHNNREINRFAQMLRHHPRNQ